MQAPEVRDSLFQWFIDIRGCLKGRLPKKFLVHKAKDLYQEWLTQQSDTIEESKQLQFSNRWIHDWMEDYSVSLKKPNKRFSISQEDHIERLIEYEKIF